MCGSARAEQMARPCVERAVSRRAARGDGSRDRYAEAGGSEYQETSACPCLFHAVRARVRGASTLLPCFAGAQGGWPSVRIRFVVAFAPGRSGRHHRAPAGAQALTPALGQNVVVENRPGAAGSVAAAMVAAGQARRLYLPDRYQRVCGEPGHAARPAIRFRKGSDARRAGSIDAQPDRHRADAPAPYAEGRHGRGARRQLQLRDGRCRHRAAPDGRIPVQGPGQGAH